MSREPAGGTICVDLRIFAVNLGMRMEIFTASGREWAQMGIGRGNLERKQEGCHPELVEGSGPQHERWPARGAEMSRLRST